MARFDCNLCGKCCQSFGKLIKIERQLTARDYYCRFGNSPELILVQVQPGYDDGVDEAYSDRDENDTESKPKGCIFLHKNPEDKGFTCAIYPTRPSICRKFRCYRMLIYHHPSGELRGKVIGVNELMSQDGILSGIWKEEVAHLPHPVESPHAQGKHSHAPGAQGAHCHDTHLHAHIHGLEHADDREWVNDVITLLEAHGYHGDPVED